MEQDLKLVLDSPVMHAHVYPIVSVRFSKRKQSDNNLKHMSNKAKA